jgi:hypothetical protein
MILLCARWLLLFVLRVVLFMWSPNSSVVYGLMLTFILLWNLVHLIAVSLTLQAHLLRYKVQSPLSLWLKYGKN